MATTIGRVDFLVGADGRLFERELRAIGESAGKSAGDGFNKSFFARLREAFPRFFRDWGSKLRASFRSLFDRSFGRLGNFFRNTFGRQGREGAKAFSDSFSEGLRDTTKAFKLIFDDVGKDVQRFSKDLARYSKDVDFGRWTDDIGNLRRFMPELSNDFGRLREITSGAKDSMTLLWHESDNVARSLESGSRGVDRHESAWRRLRNTWNKIDFSKIRGFFRGLPAMFGGANGNLEKHASLWSRLSANTRQWTLIIGAVIASISELAGLASAAGSGLFVLGAAAGSAVVGIGSLIAGFVVLNRDLKDVPAAIRPAAKAFDGLKSSLGDLAETIAIASFKGTEDSFRSLSGTVKALGPAFEVVGDAINGIVRDLASNLKPGTKSFQNLYGFIQKSAPIFDRLVRLVGRFGDTLLTAFNDPSLQNGIQGMLSWLDLLVDRFTTFVEGPGFDEWLRHGEQVFGAFGRLLDTTGRLLNDLVTDESIDQLTNFIDHIDGFLQGGGRGILEFAQKLDVFGLLAQLLDDLGVALEPLAGPMADFADALNAVISSGIDTLAAIIGDIAEQLAPLVQQIADFMKANPQGVADALLAIGGAFLAMKAGGAITTVATQMGKFFKVFTKDGITNLTKTVGPIIALTAALGGLDDFFKNAGLESDVGKLEATFGGIGAVFGPLGALIGAGIGAIVSLFTDFQGTMNDLGQGIVTAISFITGQGALGGLAVFLGSIIPEEWTTGSDPVSLMLNAIKDSITNTGDFITQFFTAEYWELLGQGFSMGMATLTAQWNAFWDGLWTTVSTWFGTVIGGLQGWINDVVTRWGSTLANLKATVSTWWTGVVAGWNSFWGTVGASIQTGWNRVTSFFSTALATLGNSWNKFWGSFGNIVSSVWGNITSTVRGAVNTVIGFINSLISKINGALSTIKNLTGGLVNIQLPSVPKAASGMLLNSPRYVLAGEAGPEAIVPLNRPLNQVDPSVRYLSAIAQGMRPPAAASGGTFGGGAQVTIEAGAFQLTAPDPWRVATEAVNQLVERMG